MQRCMLLISEVIQCMWTHRRHNTDRLCRRCRWLIVRKKLTEPVVNGDIEDQHHRSTAAILNNEKGVLCSNVKRIKSAENGRGGTYTDMHGDLIATISLQGEMASLKATIRLYPLNDIGAGTSQ